jgi:glycosyltransferase involved in cell wall biosynthesis
MNRHPLLVVFASMDPRGGKIGGVETHIRHILRNHPDDIDLLLVGIDETGDLACGKAIGMEFSGRAITFLPVAHVAAAEARISASRLFRSTTLRFVAGAIRHLAALRRLIAGSCVSADIPRVEFSILPFLLRLPFALTIHADLTKASQTDSLLKRHGVIKRWSEKFALATASAVFTVNEGIRTAIIDENPALAVKTSTLPVPVDTKIFTPSPFPETGTFHLVYAGRFDEVKDPGLMFEAIAALARRLDDRIEFHIVGAADPTVFPEFAAIRHLAVRHGPCDAEGVASIIRTAHCGILTSHSEGLPCFLLETLAAGRPFAATRLPTFEGIVVEGQTGFLAERREARAATAEAMADGLAELRADISGRRLVPNQIAASVERYSVRAIFTKLFEVHARLRTKPRKGGGQNIDTGLSEVVRPPR